MSNEIMYHGFVIKSSPYPLQPDQGGNFSVNGYVRWEAGGTVFFQRLDSYIPANKWVHVSESDVDDVFIEYAKRWIDDHIMS